MRLRNIAGSEDIITQSDYVIHEPEQYKGKWNSVFKKEGPIFLEIGMGKGKFLSTLAMKNPDINYIGMEKYASVLLRAVEKRREFECDNLFFLWYDAEKIVNLFEQDEISRIYLNFSDPWPKDRHARRRLTAKEYLARYDSFLAKNGTIEFKTDNDSLFLFSVEQVNEAGWSLSENTWDLHSTMPKDNVMTEYEEKFSALGNPIHKLTAYR